MIDDQRHNKLEFSTHVIAIKMIRQNERVNTDI